MFRMKHKMIKGEKNVGPIKFWVQNIGKKKLLLKNNCLKKLFG